MRESIRRQHRRETGKYVGRTGHMQGKRNAGEDIETSIFRIYKQKLQLMPATVFIDEVHTFTLVYSQWLM